MKNPRSVTIFYVLLVYIVFQLGWWAYLITSLNTEISTLKTELAQYTITDREQQLQEVKQLQENVRSKKFMIIGEGSVFLLLLMLGAYQTLKTFKKEQHLARMQNNFMLSVTHELKTPLASARLQLETLNKHELSREKQKTVINNALSDTDRLTDLIDNILTASRLEQSSVQIHYQPLNLYQCVTSLIEQNATFRKNSSRIDIDIPLQQVINTDRFYFELLLSNLLDNACKYAPEGQIRIFVKHLGNIPLFCISDQGKGIPEKDITRIFDKFYRPGNEETRNHKGTGLGLFIVKQICGLLHWDIKVKSNKPNGTIFEISLQKHL